MSARTVPTSPDALALIPGASGPRIDSRLLAARMCKKHASLVALLKKHAGAFAELGILRFQIGEIVGRGQPERYALLNEAHCFLVLTFARNTKRIVDSKVALIRAFGEARRAAEIRLIEYIPAHHQMHDAIKQAANGSPNERFMHMNANKELNRLAGVEAGQRPTASPLQQSLLAVGSAMAARALQCTAPGKVHDRIKAALLPLAGLLALPGPEVTP